MSRRCPSPYEWLVSAVARGEVGASDLLRLAALCDGDTIRNEFEEQMAADGRFDNIKGECAECGGDVLEGEGVHCVRCGRLFHQTCLALGEDWCDDCDDWEEDEE